MTNLYSIIFYYSLDQRTFVKANKLKVTLTTNHGEKIVEL